MNEQTGKALVGVGLLLISAGLIIWFFHDKLNWIGRLPGDFRSEGDHFKVFIPFTSMLLFSVLASLVFWLMRRIF
jgi:hypothetical protein